MNGDPDLVKADLGDGCTVAVEVQNVDPEMPVGIGDTLSFDGVSDSIEAIAQRITTSRGSIPGHPWSSAWTWASSPAP